MLRHSKRHVTVILVLEFSLPGTWAERGEVRCHAWLMDLKAYCLFAECIQEVSERSRAWLEQQAKTGVRTEGEHIARGMETSRTGPQDQKQR